MPGLSAMRRSSRPSRAGVGFLVIAVEMDLVGHVRGHLDDDRLSQRRRPAAAPGDGAADVADSMSTAPVVSIGRSCRRRVDASSPQPRDIITTSRGRPPQRHVEFVCSYSLLGGCRSQDQARKRRISPPTCDEWCQVIDLCVGSFVMSAPEFVPRKAGRSDKAYESPPRAPRLLAGGAARRSRGSGAPGGPGLGVQGPDQGYALTWPALARPTRA
jgi:hypothetical protein